LLAKRGVRLLTASGDDLTDSDDLGRKMMRLVAGAFAEYEKGRQAAQRPPAQAPWRPARKSAAGSPTPNAGRRPWPWPSG
jgi:hypothetical protein